MNRISRFARNVASNYGVTALDAVIFILLTPFVVRHLGIEHYAVWVIVQTIGYYLGFLDVGLPDAQVREHAALQRRGDTAAISRLHGTVLILFLGAGCLALLVAGVMALLPTAELLDIPASAAPEFGALLLLIGLIAFFSFVEIGVDGIFEGYQRYDMMNAIDAGWQIVSAIAVVAALSSGYGLIALAVIKLMETALGAATKFVFVRRVVPPDARPRLRFDTRSFRSIRGYSLWNSLNDLMTEGTAHFDKLLIAILLSSALVTPYSLVVALAAAIFLIAEPITETFLPIASGRHSTRDKQGLTALLSRGTKLVTMAALPVAIVVVFFGETILELWVGGEYTDIAPAVLWFTAANFFFSTYLWTALTVLMGAGEIRRIFYYSVFEVVLILALILLLVPRFELPGLAFGALLANVVTGLFLFIPAACRLTALTPSAFVARSLVPPLLAVVPVCALAYGLERWLHPDGWPQLIGAVAVTGLAAVCALLAGATTPRERARYYVSVRRLVGAV